MERNGIENISTEAIEQSVVEKNIRKVQAKLLEFFFTIEAEIGVTKFELFVSSGLFIPHPSKQKRHPSVLG